MTILIAQAFTRRKGLAELCTLIEEGELDCKNIILYERPKGALAFVRFDLDDVEGAEEVEQEVYEGIQMFIGDEETFNAKMVTLAEQGYFVALCAFDIGKKGLITATYTAEVRKDNLPDDCTCNGDEDDPCEACKKAAAEVPCPNCGDNPENLCDECIAARAGLTIEQHEEALEQLAADEAAKNIATRPTDCTCNGDKESPCEACEEHVRASADSLDEEAAEMADKDTTDDPIAAESGAGAVPTAEMPAAEEAEEMTTEGSSSVATVTTEAKAEECEGV